MQKTGVSILLFFFVHLQSSNYQKTKSMKRSFIIFFSVFSFFVGFASSDNDDSLVPDNPNIQNGSTTENNPMSNKVRIKIGSSTFTATLFGNATATAFKAMLPMIIKMTELNENEKYFSLSNNLPTNASNPGTIHTGDLMMYGSNTLVLFYETFSTSYSYTKIGHIDDTSGLVSAVGSGNVTVTFEVQ
jgi:hypothetical protein